MKREFRMIGLGFLLGAYVLFIEAIFSAFFHPSHSVTLIFNEFQEMGFEFVMTILSIPFTAYFTFDYIKFLREMQSQDSLLKETGK